MTALLLAKRPKLAGVDKHDPIVRLATAGRIGALEVAAADEIRLAVKLELVTGCKGAAALGQLGSPGGGVREFRPVAVNIEREVEIIGRYRVWRALVEAAAWPMEALIAVIVTRELIRTVENRFGMRDHRSFAPIVIDSLRAHPLFRGKNRA
jgi:hypothetical protein